MALLPDLRIGFLLARRARIISTSLWLLVAVSGLALMAAQFSGRQPATVALDVGISAIRLLLPILIILLSQELITREFDRRYFLSSLTYPRPRYQLLIARLATILFLVYTLMFVMAIVLAWITSYILSGYEQSTPVDLGLPYLLTFGFIATDLFVITAVAGLLSIVASTSSFVLIGTLGFMMITRSYANIINLLEQRRFLFDSNTELYQHSLSTLNYFLPNLAAMDIRMASLYGRIELIPDDWLANLSACLAYGIALIAFTLLFLQRKRFN